MALDASVWSFENAGQRRAARKLLNEKTPKCLLAKQAQSNDYAVDLATWQYRTGTAFLVTAEKKNHQLERLVSLPGVYAVSFEDKWDHRSKTGPEGVTALITNVPEVAKTIHKDLRQPELEGKESYTQG